MMLYPNKDSFTGSITNGSKTKGRMVYANNEIYDGEWQDDKRHGSGRMTYLDGRDVSATWFNDAIVYDTKFTSTEGDKYAG
jgi:hypothetical protein